jgi:transcriptional regulator with XRE-family HTH domain
MILQTIKSSIGKNVADYIDNPIALARIKVHIRQTELANELGVSQAYLSTVENQQRVSPKLLARVHNALSRLKKRNDL